MGWSMGGVKERYLKLAEAGDQAVGRRANLNDPLKKEYAICHPYFDFTDIEDFSSNPDSIQFNSIQNSFMTHSPLRIRMTSLTSSDVRMIHLHLLTVLQSTINARVTIFIMPCCFNVCPVTQFDVHEWMSQCSSTSITYGCSSLYFNDNLF